MNIVHSNPHRAHQRPNLAGVSRTTGAATIVAVVVALAALCAPREAQAGSCVSFNSVSACGTTINTAGCYLLSSALSVSASKAGQTCITIGTSNVLLGFNMYSISGPGSSSTGAGIQVLPTFVNSKGATVAVSNVRIEGGGQYVTSFRVGVLVGKAGSTTGPNHISIDNVNTESNVADGIQLINTSSSV